MTTTYDITTTVGQVRLIIGDTDVHPGSDAVFSDEELTYFYSIGGSVSIAAAMAAEAWAAKYAVNASSETIGDYAYTSKVVDNLLALAKRLRDLADTSLTPAMDWAELDLINVTEDTE